MAERPVLVGLIPQAVVIDPGDQVSWISDAGKERLESAIRAGRLWLNDQLVGQGEVILRDK